MQDGEDRGSSQGQGVAPALSGGGAAAAHSSSSTASSNHLQLPDFESLLSNNTTIRMRASQEVDRVGAGSSGLADSPTSSPGGATTARKGKAAALRDIEREMQDDGRDNVDEADARAETLNDVVGQEDPEVEEGTQGYGTIKASSYSQERQRQRTGTETRKARDGDEGDRAVVAGALPVDENGLLAKPLPQAPAAVISTNGYSTSDGIGDQQPRAGALDLPVTTNARSSPLGMPTYDLTGGLVRGTLSDRENAVVSAPAPTVSRHAGSVVSSTGHPMDSSSGLPAAQSQHRRVSSNNGTILSNGSGPASSRNRAPRSPEMTTVSSLQAAMGGSTSPTTSPRQRTASILSDPDSFVHVNGTSRPPVQPRPQPLQPTRSQNSSTRQSTSRERQFSASSMASSALRRVRSRDQGQLSFNSAHSGSSGTTATIGSTRGLGIEDEVARKASIGETAGGDGQRRTRKIVRGAEETVRNERFRLTRGA